MAVLSFPIPMAFLPIPIPHPLPAALSRSAISHDMSGASLEHSTSVTVLNPARQEPGKKPVTQKSRRRRRASQRYEHAQEQGRGRRSDFHLHVPSPRYSETDTDSSDSSSTRESHWIQAKRRAQVKFRLSRRRRRNNKTSGNLDESSAPNEINPVHLRSKDRKHTELTSCESCSLNLHRAKGTTYEGCGVSLSRGSSESKRPSRKQQESRGGDHHRDPQLLHRCGQNETTIKRRFSGTDSSTEMLAVKGGKSAGDAGFQEPPATDHDGSDHLQACRSVSPEKDLMPPKIYLLPLWVTCVCVPCPQNITFIHTVICPIVYKVIKWAKGWGEWCTNIHGFESCSKTVSFPLLPSFNWKMIYPGQRIDKMRPVPSLSKDKNCGGNTNESEILVEIWWTFSSLTVDIQGLGGLRSDFPTRKASSAVGASLFSSCLTQQVIQDWKDTATGHRCTSGAAGTFWEALTLAITMY